jgi:hypothetical protein
MKHAEMRDVGRKLVSIIRFASFIIVFVFFFAVAVHTRFFPQLRDNLFSREFQIEFVRVSHEVDCHGNGFSRCLPLLRVLQSLLFF